MTTFDDKLYLSLPGITVQEMTLLQQATAGLSETEVRNFNTLYVTRRKNPQDILLLTLLGFVGVAGIHRLVLGQTVMGVLYLFTGGFFCVMTVMDIINNKTLTADYNSDMMGETYHIVKMNSQSTGA